MKKIAVIGSGATAIYLLKHLMKHSKILRNHIDEIIIFEKHEILGMGMPYNPNTTDLYNLSNITSEELPELIITFADWLEQQDEKVLKELGVEKEKISKSEVYNRLALGRYLQAQYLSIIENLEKIGIVVCQCPNSEVIDIMYQAVLEEVTLKIITGETYTFNKVLIATGHIWTEDDDVESGNYASPWPIHKILPPKGTFHNFKIGTLGASLSAFDVVSSLSRRHGDFKMEANGKMSFYPAVGAEHFSLAMHDANGWLPNLQYEQEEPIREIYRHFQREDIFDILDEDGYLRMETYFDVCCRPALITAFEKDKMPVIVKKLSNQNFNFKDFVETMSKKHEYDNPFEGMRLEMKTSKKSIENKAPIHWKEVLDDLMYALNFHAEFLPAEDHLMLQQDVMPFLMNVISAMPLPSANLLLALYDAGKLEVVPGYATISNKHPKGITTVIVENGEEKSSIDYKMFINCSGQKSINLEDYPFPSLVKNGVVRVARSKFLAQELAKELINTHKKDLIFQEKGDYYYAIGGVDIDASYRVIGENGKPNDCIHDITFTHTMGVRPYSYGLQACSATSQILVEAWVTSLQKNSEIAGNIEAITELYAETEDL